MMKIQFTDLKKQQHILQNKINQRISQVLEHCIFINGPEVEEMESALSKACGASEVIACSSGTDALLISMMAIDIKPGDEIITTPFTFFATAETAMLLGAKLVFVDILQDSFNIDPSKISNAITAKTRAIIPVSLYGQTSNIDEINQIAAEHNIPVIEDAAQSFGATYKNKSSCNLTTLATTSFFPAKPLGCYGDGGAVFTNNEELADKIRSLRNHGQSVRYQHNLIGLNGRMDTLQCSIIIAKLEHYQSVEIAKRNGVARLYSKYINLANPEIITPLALQDRTHVYAQYTIRLANRDKVREKLSEFKIPTAVHYPIPLYKQPILNKGPDQSSNFPTTEKMCKEVLSLPMHPYLEDNEIQYIVEKLKLSV